MTYRDPFLHPTVVMRRDAFDAAGGYDETIRYSQDTNMWRRLVLRCDGANLPEVLYRCRVHASSIGGAHREEQRRAQAAICRAYRRDCAVYYRRLHRPSPLDRLTRAVAALGTARDRILRRDPRTL